MVSLLTMNLQLRAYGFGLTVIATLAGTIVLVVAVARLCCYRFRDGC